MATMRTLAPNPQGEHNDPEWYGTQSKRLLPLIQITKSGSIKVNKRLREELPAYFQVKYTPGERELFLRESSQKSRVKAEKTKIFFQKASSGFGDVSFKERSGRFKA